MKLTKEQESYILENAVANSEKENSFLLDCKDNLDLFNKFIREMNKLIYLDNPNEYKFDLGNLYGVFPCLIDHNTITVEFWFDYFEEPMQFKNFNIQVYYDKIEFSYDRYMTEEELKNRSFMQKLLGVVTTPDTTQVNGRANIRTVDK